MEILAPILFHGWKVAMTLFLGEKNKYDSLNTTSDVGFSMIVDMFLPEGVAIVSIDCGLLPPLTRACPV